MDNKNKKLHFTFLKPLNILLLVTGVIGLLLVVAIIVLLAVQNSLSDGIELIIEAAIILLPVALFILVIVTSYLFSKSLSNNNISLNKLTHVESLLKIDVLCLEKTGVITDGELEIKKIIPLSTVATEQYLAQWISNYLRAINDNSLISNALKREYDLELSAGVMEVLSFNEKLGYSGVSFKGGKTIVVGDPQYVNIKNKIGITKRCEEYINNGYQLLAICEGKELINEDGYPGEIDAIALIILKDHLRNGTFGTFKWFKNNNTVVKVVSSDDALATSVVATEAGVEGADKYISLEAMGAEEIRRVANEYTVFGRVNGGQKQVLIEAFKQDNSSVGMIGHNNNDLSAMESADVSIATNNSDEDIKKEADMVLNDKSFDTLLLGLKECNSYVNGLRKVVSFFLAKIVFALALSLLLIVTSLFNGDILNELSLIFGRFMVLDLLISGVIAFFLYKEKIDEKIKGSFINSVLLKTIPASIMLVLATLFVIIFYLFQKNGILNLGIYSMDTARTMIIVVYAILNAAYLYKLCTPLNKYRITLLVSYVAINSAILLTTCIISFALNIKEPVLQIPYLEMNWPAFITTIIIAVIFAAIYVFANGVIDIKKGENLEDED